jgi:hypothetical protein
MDSRRQILQSLSKDFEEIEAKIKKMRVIIENMLLSESYDAQNDMRREIAPRTFIPCAGYSFTPNPPSKDKE